MRLLRLLVTGLLGMRVCLWPLCAPAQEGGPPPGWEAAEQESISLEKTLEAVPAFRHYLTNYSARLLAKRVDWERCPEQFHIDVRFELHEDGTVSRIQLCGNTNIPAARVIIKGIKGRPHFLKWPKGMREAVGKSYIEVFMHYGAVKMRGCANNALHTDSAPTLGFVTGDRLRGAGEGDRSAR